MIQVHIKTFARVREETGEATFALALDGEAPTLAEARAALAARSDAWRVVLESHAHLCFALNQTLVRDEATPLGDGDELAIFPPVTGG